MLWVSISSRPPSHHAITLTTSTVVTVRCKPSKNARKNVSSPSSHARSTRHSLHSTRRRSCFMHVARLACCWCTRVLAIRAYRNRLRTRSVRHQQQQQQQPAPLHHTRPSPSLFSLCSVALFLLKPGSRILSPCFVSSHSRCSDSMIISVVRWSHTPTVRNMRMPRPSISVPSISIRINRVPSCLRRSPSIHPIMRCSHTSSTS